MFKDDIENGNLRGASRYLIAHAIVCNLFAKADAACYMENTGKLMLHYEAKAKAVAFDLAIDLINPTTTHATLSRREDTAILADVILQQDPIGLYDGLGNAGHLTDPFVCTRLNFPQLYSRLCKTAVEFLPFLDGRLVDLHTFEVMIILYSIINNPVVVQNITEATCDMKIMLSTRQIIAKVNPAGLITLDNDPFLQDWRGALQTLAAMGAQVAFDLASTTGSSTDTSEKATSYFSNPTPAPAPAPAPANPQGKTYNIRIAVTYTRDIVIQAATTQDLAARALTYTRGLPEELSDGFKQSNATIKRLS